MKSSSAVVVVVGRPVVVVTERRTRSSWAIKKRLKFVRALVEHEAEVVVAAVVVSAEAPRAAHELLELLELLDGQPRGAAEAEIEDECSGGRLHVSGSVRGVERRGESGLGEPERLMRLWDNMELVLDKKVSQGASYTRHQGPKLTGSPTQAETAVNGPLAVCGGEVPAATRSSFRKQGEYLSGHER